MVETKPNPCSGFTLVELIVVISIIAILSSFAVPAFTHHIRVAKEAVLREDLHTMRSAIDSYTYDKQKAPQSLDDLVQEGYLKGLPVDPFTHRSDTWEAVQSDSLSSADEIDPGINDVHSGAQDVSTEGTSYNTW
jgi:general secretion pathway protein G